MSRNKQPQNIKRIKKVGNLKDLKKIIDVEIEQDIFTELLKYLDKLVTNFNISSRSVIYRILGFLEELALKEDSDLIDECDKLAKIREKIIENIKSVNKADRPKDKKVIILKDVANRLENIEVNILYNLKSSEVLANYNIVRYILFELKDNNISLHFINRNAHLINAYDINSESIVSQIVKCYLQEIENYTLNNKSKDLFYYDQILERVLKESKITKNNLEIERLINYVYVKYVSKEYHDDNEKFLLWYDHLSNKLKDPEYEEDIEELNKLHNVNFIFSDEEIQDGYTRGSEKLTGLKGIGNDEIITIDGISTYDRDDGLSIVKLENGLYQLKVLISDPNYLFSKEDLLMKEAKRRVETYYLDDRTIGMFPREIVEEYLSLNEGKIVPLREYSYLINKYGEVEAFSISKRITNISKNYTYDEVNSLIKKCNSKEEYELIENLIELREILIKHYLDETNIDLSSTLSQNLIETYMVFNNHKLAEFFAKKDYPFVYRYHEDNKSIDTNNIDLEALPDGNKERYLKVIDDAEKVSVSAFYSIDKKSHESLNLPYYCHSTSPLRRSADLLVNECVDMFYFNNPEDKDVYCFEKYLKREVNYINDRANSTMRYYDKYHKVRKLTMK